MTESWRPKLALASASPRRYALLQQIGIVPDAVLPADVDETPVAGEKARALVTRLSREKAAVALRTAQADPALGDCFVVAADTAVSVGRRILPQCQLVDEAAHCIRLLSGRSHRVYTGDGVAPLAQIMNIFREIGFSGALSLELFNRDYWAKDPLEVARTGLEKMKQTAAL